MSKPRSTVYHLLPSLAARIPLEVLKRATGITTVFPFYHLVTEDVPLHLKFLYPARSISGFTTDLEYLLKHYKPVGIPDILDAVKSDQPLPENSFLLSFDDGLREFHDIAAPILFRKGIPATCFLNTAFIGNRDLFYRFKASLLIGKMREMDDSQLSHGPIGQWFRENHLSPGKNHPGLLKISYANRSLLDELADLLGYDFREYLERCRPYLDSGQIRSLIAQGFSFGAHSIDHPEYRFITEEEQLRQTSGSIQKLHEDFGLKTRLFSFPFTDHQVKKAFFDKVFNPIQPIADLTFGEAGLKKDTVRKNIQRIPFEEKNLGVKEILATEYLYYMIKYIFGKNLIRR
jgi:peptidoglycan/xylan/chitin deacetylase (PgdA/CDA1 family)